MVIKGLVDEDFVNYKKPSMFIAFPNCSFKCEKECGQQVCQNSTLATAPNIEISANEICKRYVTNHITQALVFGGLEPLDSIDNVFELLLKLRYYYKCTDDVVIYTGYTKEECSSICKHLGEFGNVIMKFGRFVPNQEKHYDEVLGVYLASDNQYAEKL